MTSDELKAIIEEQAALHGMTPEELMKRTVEMVGLMGSADVSALVAEQIRDTAAASKHIAEQTKILQERIRNGARRTSGNIRLPV